MINVRLSTLIDAPAIHALSAELGYPRSLAEITVALSRLIDTNGARVVVATTEHNKVVGWASVHHRWLVESGEQWELTGLVVGQNYRRRGIGHALVTHIEQWVIGQGAQKLRVRANINRLAAHSFYEKLGFLAVKNQQVYDKILSEINH